MRCARWWLRRWRPDLVPHGAALGASAPSPGRTTRRQLSLRDQALAVCTVLVRGRQVPAALVPAALAAAGHGEAEHQDEQDRGNDKQDAPHGPPPCPYLHLCAGEPGAPKTIPRIRLRQQALALPGRYGAAAWPFPRTLRQARWISPILIGWPSRGVVRALCPSSCTGSLQSWINPDDQVHHAPAEQGGCAYDGSFRTVPDDWHRLKTARSAVRSRPSPPGCLGQRPTR